MPTLSISLVDREGNKKAISVSIPTGAESRVLAFVTTFQSLTGCKVLGYGISTSWVYADGAFVEGGFDLVSEVANLRFKSIADGQAFAFKVPGALNAYDEEEEVLPAFAEDVLAALELLRGDTLQYRGGTLIAKGVSRPVKIPDLE